MSIPIASMRKWLPLCCMTVAATAFANDHDFDDRFMRGTYTNHVLVSDGAVPADFTDTNLVNGWGIVFGPTTPVWVSDNGSGKSTLYDGTGKPQALIVTVPGVMGQSGNPTGVVFNGSSEFSFSTTNAAGVTVSSVAKFIFSTESGTIAAWSGGPAAVTVVDRSSWNAVYKGLAYGANGTAHRLYASDFHNNRVDVFDGSFNPVTLATGAFTDPWLPKGYAPFGIQAINGDIYVSYARQDAAAHDEVDGPGLGFVDVYDPDGKLISRVVSHAGVNAPWGMALAPASFGEFGSALLVGNFGDGTISAYDPVNGRFLGWLTDARHHVLKVHGLWGIAFGNGVLGQKTNALYYAAGPNDEGDGAYGVIWAN
ncbi:MAG TPA: TIGR03118 family protein [Steroidobacteraceae bacterium]|nr:TIGR03118 family protein [Steroidobacteraceae bacterium]